MNQQQQQPPRQTESGPSQTTSMGHEFPTKGHLPEETRRTSIEVLNWTLADTTDLLSQVKFAHWNVRGPNFFQLHGLFEELAERLEMHADDIAERATALGGQAMGTTRLAAANSNIPEMPTETIRGEEYVELIAERLAIHDANLYDCLQESSYRNDLDTADLLNEISRDISKYRWFLEAHFITKPSGGQGMSSTGQQSGMGSQRQGQQGMESQPMESGGMQGEMEFGGTQSGMQPGMGSSGMHSGMESGGMQSGGMQSRMESGDMQSGMESGGMQSGMDSGGMQSEMGSGGMQPERGPQDIRPQSGDTQNLGGRSGSHERTRR